MRSHELQEKQVARACIIICMLIVNTWFRCMENGPYPGRWYSYTYLTNIFIFSSSSYNEYSRLHEFPCEATTREYELCTIYI